MSTLPDTASKTSRRIADRNIAKALLEGRRKASRGPGAGLIEPFLNDVAYRPVTEESIAADEVRLAAERRAAGRMVARHVMGRYGCAGPGCADGHVAHVEAAQLLLMALEVMPDPLHKPVRNAKGWTEKPKADEP